MKKMVKKSLVLVISLCLTIGLSFKTDMINASAGSSSCSYDLTWDFVDSGKHMDWDGNTKYSDLWNKAVKTWNSYKSGVIRKDTISTINDVNIGDYYDNSTTTIAYASTYGFDKIRFNKYKMDKMTTTQKQATIQHEIGHGLGLNHSYSGNIMVQGYKNYTALGWRDKNTYDCVYKNKY